MTRRYKATHEDNNIQHDIQHLSARELETLYGIQFVEWPDTKGGNVWDTVNEKMYTNLREWAYAQVDEEEWDDYEHHEVSRRFD